MIASLPMYDRPETRAETDRFWHLVRDALRDRGVAAPDELTREGDPMNHWTSPDLVMSQTCGLPYRARLTDVVTPFAVADYGLGYGEGRYASVIVSHAPGPWREARIAVNDPLSQSGWAALTVWLDFHHVRTSNVKITGSHAASARLVRAREADIAAVDAHAWQLMLSYDSWARDLFDVTNPGGLTKPDLTSPGLPFVTRRGNNPEPYFAALSAAYHAMADEDRAKLRLQGIHPASPDTYLGLPIPPHPS